MRAVETAVVETLPIRELIRIKRGPLCEACNFNPWTELHHCLVHDSKRLHAAVTVEENLMAVCRFCHPYMNGHEARVNFARKQLERGYKIAEWYQNLPLKRHEYWLLAL